MKEEITVVSVQGQFVQQLKPLIRHYFLLAFDWLLHCAHGVAMVSPPSLKYLHRHCRHRQTLTASAGEMGPPEAASSKTRSSLQSRVHCHIPRLLQGLTQGVVCHPVLSRARVRMVVMVSLMQVITSTDE